MVSTVLFSTSDECALFLEEPESHLHAGAQRFLIEHLRDGNRQVFVSSHSPTFINDARPMSIHQAAIVNGVTVMAEVTDAGAMAMLLEDIGSRNSDVLLSDAVLFVEGPGDRDAISEWAESIGKNFEDKNITVLAVGGIEDAGRQLRARAEVLAGISKAAPVRHLFVLDRDERSDHEISGMHEQLQDRLHVLQRRELENYMLVPRALRAALMDKYQTADAIRNAIISTTDQQISDWIDETCAELYGHLLLRRIRSEMRGLKGGLLTRDMTAILEPHARSQNLAARIREQLDQRFNAHLDDLDVPEIVSRQRASLDTEWTDVDKRRNLVPGTEVVERIFARFGGEYSKPRDTRRLAAQMTVDEIPDEACSLIFRVIEMATH